MNTKDNILVIVPPTATITPAVRRAAELARINGAGLYLCLFDYDFTIGTVSRVFGGAMALRAKRDFIHEREVLLDRLAADLAGHGGEVECEVVWAPVLHEAIIAKALEADVRTVVKDVSCDPSLQRVHAMPVDWKLMRLLPCDLMLVDARSPVQPVRIVAAVDLLEESRDAVALNERIVASGLRYAGYFNAEFDLLSVFPYRLVDSEEGSDFGAEFASAKANFSTLLARFAERHRIPAEHRHVLVGPPAAAISKFLVDHNNDMVIIGSIYRNSWDRLMLGSTAEGLVESIDSDMVLVRSEGVKDAIARHLDLDGLRKRYSSGLAEGIGPN